MRVLAGLFHLKITHAHFLRQDLIAVFNCMIALFSSTVFAYVLAELYACSPTVPEACLLVTIWQICSNRAPSSQGDPAVSVPAAFREQRERIQFLSYALIHLSTLSAATTSRVLGERRPGANNTKHAASPLV